MESAYPSNSRWQRIEALFSRGMNLSAREQETMLRRELPNDSELRQEMRELFFHDSGPDAIERAIGLAIDAKLGGLSIVQTAIVTPLPFATEDLIVESVRIPWAAVVRQLEREPDLMYRLDWRLWEEIVAGAYEREGFRVEVTPRSNDRGRDVIATREDIGRIRIYDQVKAYAPDRRVTANDVRSMLGVLAAEQNVSKGFVTTTSRFAPGIRKDPALKQFMPFRLELRDHDALLAWLTDVRKKSNR